jgi:hypothetical protein
MTGFFYVKPNGLATGTTASRHIIRNFLRLLGCSRQDVASLVLKAAVFTGVVPPAPTIPVHELPQVRGSLTNRAVGTGRRRPNALDAS